jgi:hypothetical protein
MAEANPKREGAFVQETGISLSKNADQSKHPKPSLITTKLTCAVIARRIKFVLKEHTASLQEKHDLNYSRIDGLMTDREIDRGSIDLLGSRLTQLEEDMEEARKEMEEAREEMEDVTKEARKVIKEAREAISRKRKRTENMEDADDESEEALPLRKRTRVSEQVQDQILSHVRYLLGLDLDELEFRDYIRRQMIKGRNLPVYRRQV